MPTPTYWAGVLTDERTIELQARPSRTLGEREVRVRVMATGICGSDVAAYRGRHPYKSAPAVLGHEFAGVVIGVGAAVTSIGVGDRICSTSFAHCELCDACRRDAEHLCTAKRPLNYEGFDGSFAEEVVIHENMAFQLGHAADGAPLSMIAGALTEPLAIAHHAVQLAGPAQADATRATVLGTGNIGQFCLVGLTALGYTTVCVDVRPGVEALARALGAIGYVDASSELIAEAAAALHGGESDVTVVANGHPSALRDASACTRPGGVIVVVSYFEQKQTIDLNPFVAKEQQIRFSALAKAADMEAALRWLRAGVVPVDAVVSRTARLTDLPTALDVADRATGAPGKSMLEMHHD